MLEEVPVPIVNHLRNTLKSEPLQDLDPRPIPIILDDATLSIQEQDKLVVQSILGQTLENDQYKPPETRTQEGLILVLEAKADLVSRAKKWVDINKDRIWSLKRSEIWQEITSQTFGDKDLQALSSQYGAEFALFSEISIAKFVSDFEFIRQYKTEVENSRAFLEKTFATRLKGGSFVHSPRMTSTPIAYVFYLHEDDFNKIADSQGLFLPYTPDNPNFSGKVILINTGKSEPDAYDTTDPRAQVTLDHEYKHALYNNFFQLYDLGSMQLSDEEGNLILDIETHKKNSAHISRYFLEHDKNEVISYHTRNSDMYASADDGLDDVYEFALALVKDKIELSNVSDQQKSALYAIYEKDRSEYDEQKQYLQAVMDLLYYVGVEEIGMDGEVIDAMFQIMPVEKIEKMVKVMLNLKSRTALEEEIAYYRDKPIRDIQNQVKEMEELMSRVRTNSEAMNSPEEKKEL